MPLPTSPSAAFDATREDFILRARKASDVLKVLSHETRLVILCMLAERERTVSEIEAALGLQQAVVSQQLARLRMQNLVETRREGRLIFYSAAHAEIGNVVDALHGIFCRPEIATA